MNNTLKNQSFLLFSGFNVFSVTNKSTRQGPPAATVPGPSPKRAIPGTGPGEAPTRTFSAAAPAPEWTGGPGNSQTWTELLTGPTWTTGIPGAVQGASPGPAATWSAPETAPWTGTPWPVTGSAPVTAVPRTAPTWPASWTAAAWPASETAPWTAPNWPAPGTAPSWTVPVTAPRTVQVTATEVDPETVEDTAPGTDERGEAESETGGARRLRSSRKMQEQRLKVTAKFTNIKQERCLFLIKN